MSQRIEKVESLIQQIAATGLRELMSDHLGEVTVTTVDAAPDLRSAVVWIGLLVDGPEREQVWQEIEELRPELQRRLAATMTTKYVPRLSLRQDTSGEYAQAIERIIKEL